MKALFDIVKQWKWYDWAMLFIRMMGASPDHKVCGAPEPVYRIVMARCHVGNGAFLDTLAVSASKP